MLNLLLWLGTLAGCVALVLFAWRSAMRRRGFRLLKLLEAEHVLRYAVDVPVTLGEPRAARRPRPPFLQRRGTLVLTRRRLAGFSHRARFVLVRGGDAPRDAVRARSGWLLIKPGRNAPLFSYEVPDAEGWSSQARRTLRR